MWYALFLVPLEKSTSHREGTREGPGSILNSILELPPFNMTLMREIRVLDEGVIESAGKEFLIPLSPGEAMDFIFETACRIVDRGLFPISLGGEHTISWPVVRACRRLFPDLAVFHFDAHGDRRDSYEGNLLSHACAMRRIEEEGIGVISMGVRSLCREEIRSFRGKEGSIHGVDIDPALISSNLSRPIYVSIDVDVLDPLFMPSTGALEPPGFDWYTLIRTLRAIFDGGDVIGFDLVEYAPDPFSPWTSRLCARLVQSLIGFAGERRGRMGANPVSLL